MAAASYYNSSPALDLSSTTPPALNAMTELDNFPSHENSAKYSSLQQAQPSGSHAIQRPPNGYNTDQDDTQYDPYAYYKPSNPAGDSISLNPLNEPDKDLPKTRSRRRFQKWKRALKFLQSLANSISTLVNLIIFGIMLYVNISYYRTKGDKAGGISLWPQHTKEWPSLMMLVASLVTMIVSVGTLIAYCAHWNRAKRSWKVTLAKYIIHIGAWIVVSTLYKKEKGTNDLWGWSCSNKTSAIETASGGKVDFSRLCSIQVGVPCTLRVVTELTRSSSIHGSLPSSSLLCKYYSVSYISGFTVKSRARNKILQIQLAEQYRIYCKIFFESRKRGQPLTT